MRKFLAQFLIVASLTTYMCVAAAQAPVPPTQPTPQTSPASVNLGPVNSVPAQSQPATTTPVEKNGSGVYTVKSSARLVVLDVVVTDKKGNIVDDLKRDDFSVTEAGEPQTVLNFETAGAHLVAPEVTINSTADLDKLAPRAPVNIILLDEFNTRFEDMAFARYSLKKFLEKQPDKLTTPTMLVAVNLQHFTVLHDYTQDKQAVISALDHHFVSNPWQNLSRSWIPERVGTAFGTLMRVAQATVGHQGHKNMIWIGRGFPALNFANLQVDSASRVENAVQECVNSLRDARVTLYSIDPAGLLVDSGVYGSDAAFTDPFGGNYEFNRLAKATGGRALYGRNDVDAEIGTTVRNGTSFYTLTYRPANDSLDPQKFRKIVVTLNRPGLTATAREGYYLQRRPAAVDPKNPSRRLAFELGMAESSNMAYDGVPITVTPKPNEPDSFIVRVEARGLSWTAATETDPHRYTEVVLMATTFDRKGKELKRDAHAVKVAAPPTVAPTGRLEMSASLPVKLDHNPKAVRARFVVRVNSSGRIGTADYTLSQ